MFIESRLVTIQGTNEAQVATALKRLAGLPDSFFLHKPFNYHPWEGVVECGFEDPEPGLPGNRTPVFRVWRETQMDHRMHRGGREVGLTPIQVRYGDNYSINLFGERVNPALVSQLADEVRRIQAERWSQTLVGRLCTAVQSVATWMTPPGAP